MFKLNDIKYVVRTPKGEFIGKSMNEAEIIAKTYIEYHGSEGVTIERIYVYDAKDSISKSYISPRTKSDGLEMLDLMYRK